MSIKRTLSMDSKMITKVSKLILNAYLRDYDKYTQDMKKFCDTRSYIINGAYDMSYKYGDNFDTGDNYILVNVDRIEFHDPDDSTIRTSGKLYDAFYSVSVIHGYELLYCDMTAHSMYAISDRAKMIMEEQEHDMFRRKLDNELQY